MSTETPKFEAYQSIVKETEDFALASCREGLPDEETLIILVRAILSADQHLLTVDDLAQAVKEGLSQGITLYHDVQQGGRGVEYWREVRQEAETYWAVRSRTGDEENI